jgi:hypothetical protein
MAENAAEAAKNKAKGSEKTLSEAETSKIEKDARKKANKLKVTEKLKDKDSTTSKKAKSDLL